MLQIPTVTQDDLDVFRTRIFGTAASPAKLSSTGRSRQDVGVPQLIPEDEDDLGYYPDGNKRTLTDDQIAMFRHSEIYSILRERQVRKENEEADGVDGPDEPHGPTVGLVASGIGEPVNHTGRDHAHEDEDIPNHELIDPSPPAETRKRKRDNADAGERPGKAYTSRRLARELDSVTDEHHVLDYGDEPAEDSTPVHAHPEPARSDTRGGVTQKDTLLQGQKIWWPVIQAE